MKRREKIVAFAVGIAVIFSLISCKKNAEVDDEDWPSVQGYYGSKYPYEARKIGDIIFVDGSVTPYTDEVKLSKKQKAAAIAVIFYVGTELNSGNDSTTTRTLGVGMANTSGLIDPDGPDSDWAPGGLQWCTKDASCYSRRINSIECTVNGNPGFFTITGDKNGIDNLEQLSNFILSNSLVNDVLNSEKYPAFYFAKNYKYQNNSRVKGSSYEEDWYLPSIAELDKLYKVIEPVDDAIRMCGGSYTKGWSVWSSTPCKDYNWAFSYALRKPATLSNPIIKNEKSFNNRMALAIREF